MCPYIVRKNGTPGTVPDLPDVIHARLPDVIHALVVL